MKSRLLTTLLLGLAAFGVLEAQTTAAAASMTYCPHSWVAHRGAGTPSPNSFDSRLAVQASITDPLASAVESDVWATKDGQGLMQHSNGLDASTNGTGLISDHTLAEIQSTVLMTDGSVPESLPEFLAQVVSARMHAVLHDKSPSLNAYVDAQMRAVPGAHRYVRIMTTFDNVGYFVEKGWYVAMASSGLATSARVQAALAAHAVVVVVDISRLATASNRIQPYITAGLRTDYVTYSSTQDLLLTQYAFNRGWSGNIPESQQTSGCTA